MYEGCFDAVQRFCYFKLPGKTDGDDVLQEVAAAAWSRRESVRSADSFKPWLMQIAANKIRDFYRRRAKQLDVPLDETYELSLADSRRGITVVETVNETLDVLGDDGKILTLFYLRNVPQAEIARRLGVPLGTVKSRLHTARQRFKTVYPHPPKKGGKEMNKLPKVLPEYAIAGTDKPPFECVCEELMGWFLVPRPGEKISWANYDMPERVKTEECRMQVTGRAVVHGIEGVEINVEQDDCAERKSHVRKFVAQLTDTHVRYLAGSHTRGDVKYYSTFLDGDAFLDSWGSGEDNCGDDIRPKRKGIIKRDGSVITCPAEKYILDVVDRCTVTLGGKEYDTIRVMYIECSNGIVTEDFLDQNGRTVLWRRFNRDDWHFDYYKQKWIDRLPNNERLVVNGETYVHWYDGISDYILQ